MTEPGEVEYMTETKKLILEGRKAKGITKEQVFVKHSLHAVASIAHKLGLHAALTFLAILGTSRTVSDEDLRAGFTIRNSFRDATQLPARQFRRAVARLAEAGYITADTGPGRKPRVTLTAKGRRAIPGGLHLVRFPSPPEEARDIPGSEAMP